MAKSLTCLLVTIESGGETTRKVVNESPFFVGRAPDCAIAFSGLSVSRHHLLVKNKAGSVWVEDQGSANGTYLNGTRMEGKRLTPLAPGDRVRLGTLSVEMTIESVPRAFSESVLDESSIGKKDRDSLTNIIHGAHAEALRLVELGKNIHDNFLKSSEDKKAAFERQMAANFDQVKDEASKQAHTLLEKAKAQHDKVVAAAESDAAEAARATTERLKEEARTHGEQLIEAAKRSAAQILADAQGVAEDESREQRTKNAQAAQVYFDERSKEFEAQFESRKVKMESDLGELNTTMNAHKDELTILNDRRTEIDAGIQAHHEISKAIEKKIADQLAQVAILERQTGDMRAVIATVDELEAKRKSLAAQLATLTSQLAKAEQSLAKNLAENQTTIEAEAEKRRGKQEEEFTLLRLAEMERLKHERAAAMQELAREHRRLGQKILIEVEAAAVKTMPAETWRAAMKDVENAIHQNLKISAVAAASDDSISPLILQMAKRQRRLRLLWTAQGLFAGMLILIGMTKAFDGMLKDDNPARTAAEERSRQNQEDLERRRFNPSQDDQWRDSYTESVIYTRDFVENYQAEDFQKLWLKEAASYFLKKWKVQEETVVQVIAALNTLVGTLNERKTAIHPDFVKDGVKKMDDLESETMAQVKELLGSEVRVEALKRLEKRTFTDFYGARQPAQAPGANDDTKQ